MLGSKNPTQVTSSAKFEPSASRAVAQSSCPSSDTARQHARNLAHFWAVRSCGKISNEAFDIHVAAALAAYGDVHPHLNPEEIAGILVDDINESYLNAYGGPLPRDLDFVGREIIIHSNWRMPVEFAWTPLEV